MRRIYAEDRSRPQTLRFFCAGEPYRLLSLPDHATPLALRTHTREPVPFAFYDSERLQSPYRAKAYDESACAGTGLFIGEGHTLFGRVVSDQGL